MLHCVKEQSQHCKTCAQALREQRHADAEAKSSSKGTKKGKDKAKEKKEKKEKKLSTADAAKEWRNSQLTADKGHKRCLLFQTCSMTQRHRLSLQHLCFAMHAAQSASDAKPAKRHSQTRAQGERSNAAAKRQPAKRCKDLTGSLYLQSKQSNNLHASCAEATQF